MNNLWMPLGSLLLIAGIVLALSNGFTYTTEQKVVDMGPIEVNAETQKTIPPSPLAVGGLLVGGAVLIFAGSRKQAA